MLPVKKLGKRIIAGSTRYFTIDIRLLSRWQSNEMLRKYLHCKNLIFYALFRLLHLTFKKIEISFEIY